MYTRGGILRAYYVTSVNIPTFTAFINKREIIWLHNNTINLLNQWYTYDFSIIIKRLIIRYLYI